MINRELISFETPSSFPYYSVKLNNGETIFQQEREGDIHSWLRLKLFLEKNPELRVVGMEYSCENSTIPLPQNQDGYCFGKKRAAVWPGNKNHEIICIGHFNGDKGYLTWIDGKNVINKEVRDEKNLGFFLIKNER